jgi:hypothetical protein
MALIAPALALLSLRYLHVHGLFQQHRGMHIRVEHHIRDQREQSDLPEHRDRTVRSSARKTVQL